MIAKQKIAYVFLFFLILQDLKAQQLPLFTQYREYHSIINPAMVSSDFMLNTCSVALGASARMQWVGLKKNAPSTQVLRGEWVLDKESSMTLVTGGHIIQDRAGRESATSFSGRLGVYLSDNPNSTLALWNVF